MNIGDIVALGRTILSFDRFESDDINNCFNIIKKTYGVDYELIEIESSEVFPQIVLYSNKNYIIWDNSLFKIFEKLNTLLVLTGKPQSDNIIEPLITLNDNIYLKYLSLKLIKKDVFYALAFAKKYNDCLPIVEKIEFFNSTNQIRTYKVLIYLHEFAHLGITQKNINFSEVISDDKIIDLFHVYKQIISKTDLDNEVIKNIGGSKYHIRSRKMDILRIDFVNKLLDDKRDLSMFEEVKCDLFSNISAWTILKTSYLQNNVDIKSALDNFLFDISILSTNLNCLRTLSINWEQIININTKNTDFSIDNIKSDDANYQSLVRNQFSCGISEIYLRSILATDDTQLLKTIDEIQNFNYLVHSWTDNLQFLSLRLLSYNFMKNIHDEASANNLNFSKNEAKELVLNYLTHKNN